MLRRLAQDRRGVSAVEFALIAPLMILIYLGLAELTMSMMSSRRASHAASAIGDLVARDTQVNATEMTDVFTVGEVILKPFSTTNLSLRVTSVKADAGGTPKVVWSRAKGPSFAPLAAGGAPSGFPAGLIAANESVIMSEARYVYASPVKYVMPNDIVFKQVYYLRPRTSDEVLCNAC